LRLLPLVFWLTAVLAAQSPEAMQVASLPFGDLHGSSSFRSVPGSSVRGQAATFANRILFAHGPRESSLESEFLL
jgi:hypothetical protein